MIHEHAIEFRDRRSEADLDYIVRKANRLGLAGKTVVEVSTEKDEFSSHIYFYVSPPNDKRGHG